MGIFYNNITEQLDIFENIYKDILESNNQLDLITESLNYDSDNFLYINEGTLSNIITKVKTFFKELFRKIKAFILNAKNIMMKKIQQIQKDRKDLKDLKTNGYFTVKVYDYHTLCNFPYSENINKISNNVDSDEIYTEYLQKLETPGQERYHIFNSKTINGEYTIEEYKEELFKNFRNGESEPHEKKISSIYDAFSGRDSIVEQAIKSNLKTYQDKISETESDVAKILNNLENMKDTDPSIVNDLISKLKGYSNNLILFYTEKIKASNEHIDSNAKTMNRIKELKRKAGMYTKKKDTTNESCLSYVDIK